MLCTAEEAALLECSSRSSGSHRSPRPLGKVSSPSVGSPGSCLLLARASSAPQLPPRSTHPAPFYLADIPIKLSPVSADAQQGPAPLSAGAPSVATSHSLAIRQGGAILRSLSERGPSLLRSKSFGQELTHGGGEHERSVPGHPLNTHHSLEVRTLCPLPMPMGLCCKGNTTGYSNCYRSVRQEEDWKRQQCEGTHVPAGQRGRADSRKPATSPAPLLAVRRTTRAACSAPTPCRQWRQHRSPRPPSAAVGASDCQRCGR